MPRSRRAEIEALLAGLATPRPGWERDAACGEIPVETIEPLFFPYDSPMPEETQELCQGCPVREECLATALAAGYRDGIWGGVDMRAQFGRGSRSAAARASRAETEKKAS